MKVAYFAESPADQAALQIFTEAILRQKTELVTHRGLRRRGWPSVRMVLSAVLKELHYHSDAEAFVLVVDSDSSPPHLPGHESSGSPVLDCRLCQLRRIADDVQRQVRSRPHLPPMKIGLGLAVPQIEAWLLCGVDSHVTEAAWINGLRESRMPYSKIALKEKFYGTARPSLPVETDAMKSAATRLSENLETLERMFPHGFGTLARSLRTW